MKKSNCAAWGENMAARSRSSLQLFLSAQASRVICSRNVQVKSAEATPVYPPILPSRTAKSKSAKRRVLLEFFDRLRTVEPQEKISALTRIQRMKYVVCPQTPAVGADKWYQHFTKTAFLPGLPDELSSPADLEESVGSELRSILSDALLQEHWHMKKGRAFIQKEYKQFANPFLKNAVSGLVASLARTNPVLQLSSLDLSPHVNFYWVNGERTIPRGHRSGRVEPQRFQIDDRPHSQIRVRKQLPEFVPLGTDVAAEVPVIHFAPDCLPLFRRQYENNISTGAKLQDPCCYGHTQFHVVPDRFHRDTLNAKNLSENIEVFLRANAIASLFAWTGAQAMYQGFWSEQDLNRPFVSQAVITDGQYFSFFCYQLNTLALSSFSVPDNPRKNLCWGTESLCLYDRVTDGDVIGWNDDVFKLLVKFLLNKA